MNRSWFQLFFVLFFVTLMGCATPGVSPQATTPHRFYHLVVQVPRNVLGDYDFAEHHFIATWTEWADARDGGWWTPTYCVLTKEHLECMTGVHETHVKFQLERHYLQPDPRTLSQTEQAELARWGTDEEWREAYSIKVGNLICEKVRVGITADRFTISGGQPRMRHWFDLEPTLKDSVCDYRIPQEFFVAASAGK